MIIFNERRHDAVTPAPGSAGVCPELQRLIEARSALEHARRQAKWKRKCKTLQAAAHEAQVAALAARDAGISWIEIGDVLGIDRAAKPFSSS